MKLRNNEIVPTAANLTALVDSTFGTAHTAVEKTARALVPVALSEVATGMKAGKAQFSRDGNRYFGSVSFKLKRGEAAALKSGEEAWRSAQPPGADSSTLQARFRDLVDAELTKELGAVLLGGTLNYDKVSAFVTTHDYIVDESNVAREHLDIKLEWLKPEG